jgi:signal transduction histidine kinase
MTVRAEISRDVVLPKLGGRSEAEVRRLYDNAPIGFAATVINASILVGILRDWVEPSVLALWWTSLMGLTAARFAHGEWFRRVASRRDFDTGRWTSYFVSGIFAAGLLWGAAGVWLLPQSVPHQTFVAFVLGGMVAGASATFSVRMDAFLAYTVPALAPLAIRFLSMGDELHVAMGGMVILFGLLLTATAHRIHQLTSRTAALSGELTEARSILKTASDESTALVARLERSEESRVATEREMRAQFEKTEERIRRYFVDITDAFVTVQERTERRLESTFERRTEEAKSGIAASVAQGAAYRVRETCREIADLVRLARREEKMTSASARETLRGIDSAVGRAELFVDDLLAFAGAGTLDPVSTDVGDFMRSFARRWVALRPANIEVWWNWCGEPLLVRAAPGTLDIVLRNLLANAREAIGDERGTIEVRARRASRQELATMPRAPEGVASDSFLTLEVLDDGAGMTQATLEHIFDPFFSTKSRDRGLGMAIVLAIVNRHGGRVVVDSVPLRGTGVRLLLPEARPAGDPSGPKE